MSHHDCDLVLVARRESARPASAHAQSARRTLRVAPLANVGRLLPLVALASLTRCAPPAPIPADVIEDRAVEPRSDASADAQAVQTRAGASCTEDATCGDGLRCELTLSSPGFCTAPCQQSRMPGREAEQCGGGRSTCLQHDDGVTSPTTRCLRACDAEGRRAESGCREGFVCTGNTLLHALGVSDTPACRPFCRVDAHCPAGTRCNPRTGLCGGGLDTSRLPDGALCMPVDPTGGTQANGPCRGFCAWIGSASDTVGVCVSLGDGERNEGCPDDPLHIAPIQAPRDNMFACGPRNCSATDCCEAGLECREFNGAPVCVPVDASRDPLVACEATDGGRGDGGSDATVDATTADGTGG